MGMHFSTIKICLIWKLCYEAKNKRQAIKVFFSNKDWQVFSWFSSEHFKYKEYNLTWGTIVVKLNFGRIEDTKKSFWN